MEKLVVIIIITLFTSCNYSNWLSDNSVYKTKSDFIETEENGIRKTPITNREYLIYLCWNISVYGNKHPEMIFDLLPKENFSKNDFAKGGYFLLLQNSTSTLKDYIMNARFIDFPLIGLSVNQVLQMEKWLSDRYNENILIEYGYLNYNPNQQDQDCFVLESYLLGQYQGSVCNGKNLYWKEHKFLPTFRLPKDCELSFLNANLNDKVKMKAYKFRFSNFLAKWNTQYIQLNKINNEITLKLNTPVTIKNNNNYIINEDSYSDEILIVDSINNINTKYLDEVGYKEKDAYGKMEFIIIGESSLERPIIANPFYINSDVPILHKIYRIAYNKKIEYLNWPQH